MDAGRDALASISEDLWLARQEGQLSVDVIETEREIIVRSAVAGVRSSNLDIALTADTLTIRGERALECEDYQEGIVHLSECYWGAFSRSIVLPHPVRPDAADAEMKDGILTIRLKKAEMEHRIAVNERHPSG